MRRYYDKQHNRLVYFERKASPQFWDEHWNIDSFRSLVESNKSNAFILNNTRRFLKKGVILEGGCGMGGNVYCLHHNCYSAFGVDFAGKTIEKINKEFPELKIRKGDVRNLKFEDNFFDGYWSLGVIEHFYEGYEDILKEMKRVIKKGGYVFLTFPYLSPLRKFKAKLGLYKKYENSNCYMKNFYQFALDTTTIQDDFEKYGFILKHIKPILQKLYDYNDRNKLIYRLRSLLTSLLAKFSAHIILMIFQRKTEKTGV